MFSDALKNITHADHQSLEALLIPVIKNVFTPAAYIELLKLFYGYYKPVEDAVGRLPVAAVLPDYPLRRKAGLILNDLQAFGEKGAVPLCTFTPALFSMEEAFGALYVLEGSTLGGAVIAKILQRNLQRSSEQGFAFFHGYGALTHPRWLCFKEALDLHFNLPEQQARMAAAAGETFIQLKNWAQCIYQYERAKEKL